MSNQSINQFFIVHLSGNRVQTPQGPLSRTGESPGKEKNKTGEVWYAV